MRWGDTFWNDILKGVTIGNNTLRSDNERYNILGQDSLRSNSHVDNILGGDTIGDNNLGMIPLGMIPL